jgi:hypothetical protein
MNGEFFSRSGGFHDASTRRERISGYADETFIYLRRGRVNHDVGGFGGLRSMGDAAELPENPPKAYWKGGIPQGKEEDY